MTRRAVGLFAFLALGVLLTPLAADAQQVTKVPRLDAFRQGLASPAMWEGQSIAIEYRWAPAMNLLVAQSGAEDTHP